MQSDRTIRLHRVFRAPPQRLFQAFVNPLAKVKWMPPHGFVGEVHSIDVRPGGSYRMSFVNLGTGQRHSFGGRYVQIIPNELLRYTDRFDDPSLPGEMAVTVRLRPVMGGTELEITQEDLPEVIPLEMCYLGWQESLELLGRLVEPEIP